MFIQPFETNILQHIQGKCITFVDHQPLMTSSQSKINAVKCLNVCFVITDTIHTWQSDIPNTA